MNGFVAHMLANARREWVSNRRLRLGVVAISIILGLYAVLVLRDWRASLEQEYATVTTRLNKMKALAGQQVWIGRASASAQLRDALEAQIPEVATPGMAQASFQGWIREATVGMGDEVRVQSQEAAQVEDRPGIWQVPVVVSGPFDPQRFLDLVGRIERRPALTVVREATILNRDGKTFSVTVVSYFRVRGGGDAGS